MKKNDKHLKKIILSIHLVNRLNIPKDAILRVNMTFVKTREDLERSIKKNDNDIFLDYPIGRVKPPTPLLGLEDALYVMNKCSNIKYFAISNSERPTYMAHLRSIVPDRVKLVPKIETASGVKNLNSIVKAAKTDMIMLDKTDLFFDVKIPKIYNKLLDRVRQSNINVFELQGVVFGVNIK